MADEIQLWRQAQDDAELTTEEVELVLAACEGTDGIRLELSYLVTQLSQNLGGPFLREFVDQLRERGPDAQAADSLMAALLKTILPDGGQLAGEGA